MAISATDKELIKYFIRLSNPQKKSLLELMKSFLSEDKEASKTTSLKNYNKELDEAMKRIDNGNFTTLEELEKEMKEW
jgi:hypothetical protein